MPIILDGKSLSLELFDKLKENVNSLKTETNRIPKLAIILVGNNIASQTYVKNKIKACKYIGIESKLIKLDISSEITQPTDEASYNFESQLSIEKRLEESIYNLNEDKSVDGIIVQLPLPKNINIDHIINSINPKKDVDGLHPFNLGKMALGLSAHKPATPSGILELLKNYKIPTSGKHCVILGRSRIVGTPLSILMSQNKYPGNCTVTICHSYTKDIKEITKTADILISAIGKPKFVTEDMVKEGTVVIDVGINRIEDKNTKKGYRLEGDVDYEKVSPKCSHITPVPKGVGPMTIASLMKNTIKAASYDFEGF